jgi:methylglutaconyl-CoA hydratase
MATLSIERGSKGVLRIEMARPEIRNAFDEAMIAEIDAAFAEAASDANVRCIVLAGQGNAFSAGADLAWMKRQSEAPESANVEDARRFAGMLHRVASCPKPTIARVQGACMGGGVGLVCACDFAIAGESARFAVSEARFGILPSVIAPYLIAAVGVRQAKRLALSTVQLGANDALALGLVHEVHSDDELDAAVAALTEQLGKSGPDAMAEIKSLYGKLAAMEIGDATRELTATTIARVRASDEAREGFAAFLEKRPARWIRVDETRPVLREFGQTRQDSDEYARRWFSSVDCDLILWLNPDESLLGFQFCYDKPVNEHALTWISGHGFSHMKVDSGERYGPGKAAPILMFDGVFDERRVLDLLQEESRLVPAEHRQFIIGKVAELVRSRESQA